MATVQNLINDQRITKEQKTVQPINQAINHMVGVSAKTITYPSAVDYKGLHLKCEVAGARLWFNSSVTASAGFPGADVTNGNGSWYLAAGDELKIAAPGSFRAVGTSTTTVLTYYWF